jgi:O-antigen ligase
LAVLADHHWRWIVLGSVPVTALWLALVAFRVGGEEIGVLIPFAVIGMAITGFVVWSAASRNQLALLTLLVAIVVVLSYRVRVENIPGEAVTDSREVQNYVKVGVWACVMVPCLVNWRSVKRVWADPGFAWMLAFVLLSVISAAWSMVPAVSGLSALGLLMYLSFACLLTDAIDEKTLIATLIWSLAGYCVINWLAAAMNPATGILDTGEFRLQGISGHPNMLASQAVIMMCLVIGGYSRNYISRRWYYIILGVGIVTLVATKSRTSTAAFLASVALLRYRRLFVAAAMVVLIVMTFVIITGQLDALTGLLVRDGNDDALAGRGDIWDYLTMKVSAQPLLGYGFNAFEANVVMDNPPNLIYPTVIPLPSHPHNNFLEVLFSGGLITLLPFVAWNVAIFRRWCVAPDLLRDLIVLFNLVSSFTEVSIAGPPFVGTLVLFIVLGLKKHAYE